MSFRAACLTLIILAVAQFAGCPSGAELATTPTDPNLDPGQDVPVAPLQASRVSPGAFVGTVAGTARVSNLETHTLLSEDRVSMRVSITYTQGGDLYLDNRLMGDSERASTPGAGTLSSIDFEHKGYSEIGDVIRTIGTVTINHDNGDTWTGPFVYTFNWLDHDQIEFYYEYRTVWVQDPSLERFEAGRATIGRKASAGALPMWPVNAQRP